MAEGLFLLFDGHALVHRAFHAIQEPLAVSKTGEPTKAVYGFARMLLKVLGELKPTHWAVAFDSAAPTFRHVRFKAYKAQRPATPDELRSQFRRVRELVEAFNITTFEMEGYEADDVLGALCRQAAAQGIDTIIVTGDTDTMQLISPRVRVLTSRPGRPFGDTVIYDEAKVEEKYGVRPDQMADFKGLKGDPSDNIPGVPGIGEKTAVRLIERFSSVEGIYEALDQVDPQKVQQTLRENEEAARLSKELATIVTELPLTLDLEKCRVEAYSREKLVELFRELEFSSLMGKLPEAKEPPKGAVGAPPRGARIETKDYRIVSTEEALEEVIGELTRVRSFTVDVETTGKEAQYAELVGVSLSTAPGRAWYVPVGHRGDGAQLPLELVLDRLRPLLEDPTFEKVAHNGKYDMTVLSNYGVALRNLAFDTMIAAYLLGEKALGLKALAFTRLGLEMTPISDLIGTGAKQGTMAEVSIPLAADYACADADITGRLRGLLEGELHQQGLWRLFTEVEMPLVPVLLRLERNGVALDTASLREMSRLLAQDMVRLEAEIYKDVGHQFNINSPQQLGGILFEELRLPRSKKTKSGYSTDAAVLEKLKGTHPVIERLLDYRQVMKLKSTYVDALPALIDSRTGRVHTTFNQTATATGRLSSSEPNLQNLPVRGEGGQVRRAIVAQEGALLLSGDYSQIDLRVLAHLSQDPGLLRAFARDEDIHAATASQVFGVPLSQVTPDMRRVAKTVNFGVSYGMSEYGLEQATELSREEAAQFIATYFEKYSGVKEYIIATKEQAHKRGYVETLLGRRRYIPEINSSNAQVRMGAERMAINMPVQGTSADIIKIAMINLQREMDELGLEAKMTLQVHDELLFEVPQRELEEMKRLVLKTMPAALELSVPLKVEVKVGKNWEEMG